MSVNFEDLKRQLARLDFFPPYNVQSNIVASIEREFGYGIKELRMMLEEYESNKTLKPVREMKEELKFSDLLPTERKLVEEMVSRAPTMKLVVRGEGHGPDYQEYTSESVMEVSDYLAHYQSALNRVQAQREIFGVDDKETISGKIQTLRYHSGASSDDVRKALEENELDYWFAYKQLREKGLGVTR